VAAAALRGYTSAMTHDEPRSIFISGAASGIGRATALLFAERGWRVGGYDIDARALAALDKELAPAGGVTGPLDVTDPASFSAAIESFGRVTGGRLDLFHNNAGIAHSGFFEDVPQQAARRIIDVNFVGVVNGAYAALPLLRATPNSLCFNTASSSAIFGVPSLAVYSATKFAVKGLTEALSVEFARHGVRVGDVLPGLIDTPLLDGTPNHSGTADDGILARDRAPKEGPFRLIAAREVADVVWSAYHDEAGQLHWYVPAELRELEAAKAAGPEKFREMLSGIATGEGETPPA
jgi:NAD(P)-dependent dehydrogenase (short-subunit alcohol dehydrogenase family)